MDKHKNIVRTLAKELENDSNNIAMLVTGSVARGEYTQFSDLDLIVISQVSDGFKEQIVDGILVETKSNTVEGYVEKIHLKPMNVYQWLDAKVLFDKENIAQNVIQEAKRVYDSYIPTNEEMAGNRKWLSSVQQKIASAKERNDQLAIGFYVSNVLWQIVSGSYLVSNQPLPPSTTALRRIIALRKLPADFDKLWQQALTADLETRTTATLALIDFVLNQ